MKQNGRSSYCIQQVPTVIKDCYERQYEYRDAVYMALSLEWTARMKHCAKTSIDAASKYVASHVGNTMKRFKVPEVDEKKPISF